jgi:hypothetical protein
VGCRPHVAGLRHGRGAFQGLLRNRWKAMRWRRAIPKVLRNRLPETRGFIGGRLPLDTDTEGGHIPYDTQR